MADQERVSRKIFLAASAGLLFAACGTSGLKPLVLEGHELHASLVTPQIDDAPIHVSRGVLRNNPQLSTDAEFIEAIARSGSQGQLGGEGIRAALYAVYLGEGVRLGIYGLEAASSEDAFRIEGVLRSTWAHNASLDVTRVYRSGGVLVVVWAVSETPACWEEVNAAVAERLVAPWHRLRFQ